MGSNSDSPISDTDDAKGAFRKPTNEVAGRKYRRRSPASRSASPDVSQKQDLRSSPTLLKEDKRRKHNAKEDRVSGRSDHEQDGDSRRYSPKASQGHTRDGKYVDEEDRNYSRLSSRSGRQPRGGGGAYSDYKDRGDYNRSRDYHHKDKYNRDKYDGAERANRDKHDDRDRRGRDRDHRDEKRDYVRSSRDIKSDCFTSCEDSKKNQDDIVTRRESNRQKEDDKIDCKAEGRSKHLHDDASAKRNEGIAAKRQTLSRFDSKDPTTGSNQGQDLLGKDTHGETVVKMPEPAGNLDAAKIAAIRAAELVNKNLIGTGVMTADQKKKLLWGSKKTTTTEEPSHRWDSAIFPDRERQEKFNKLMGVKGEVKLAQSPDSDPIQSEKQRELQMDLEKQYTAGLRRRDGRTVGLGL